MSRVAFLEQQIEELLELAKRAASAESNQPGAAVAARGKAADLRKDLDQLRAYEADRATQRTPLEEVRAMRQRADAAGSHISARDFLKMELDLLAKAEAKRVADAEAALEHLGEAELVAMFVDQIRGLPPEVGARVLEQLASAIH